MLPSGTALEHPFRIDNLYVGIPGCALYFCGLAVRIGDDVCGAAGYVQRYFSAEGGDPEGEIGSEMGQLCSRGFEVGNLR
jgi:hypothetical protein